MSNPYARHNEKSKANFDAVYDLPDPRGYFEALGSLDYRAPEHGGRVFGSLLDLRREEDQSKGRTQGRPAPKVLDLCCSYGVNAALLKCDLTLDDLYERYRSEEIAGLSGEELVRSDRAFYAAHRRRDACEVAGTDAAQNAVRYAVRAGLLDAGAAENLEEAEPTPELARASQGVSLISVTGGVGYIWEHTFERVLRSVTVAGGTPWVAAFAVRFVDYGPIAAVLARHGLVTEKVSVRTFAQRRFRDAAERDHVLEQLARAGVDPTGREEAGWYHADLYLSRPADGDRSLSADRLLGGPGLLDY
ncbi:hypothetical protein [Rubrobacter indicoceani]|uniref:hypothetical protein n=1 Tax=Rubrobacter indicoceani TaxID=2051957 RepID=UPI000E5B8E5C|nr:hypothetical protein [Rubrobacter indicoceani]